MECFVGICSDKGYLRWLICASRWNASLPIALHIICVLVLLSFAVVYVFSPWCLFNCALCISPHSWRAFLSMWDAMFAVLFVDISWSSFAAVGQLAARPIRLFWGHGAFWWCLARTVYLCCHFGLLNSTHERARCLYANFDFLSEATPCRCVCAFMCLYVWRRHMHGDF